jgi:hypothetical protein
LNSNWLMPGGMADLDPKGHDLIFRKLFIIPVITLFEPRGPK